MIDEFCAALEGWALSSRPPSSMSPPQVRERLREIFNSVGLITFDASDGRSGEKKSH